MNLHDVRDSCMLFTEEYVYVYVLYCIDVTCHCRTENQSTVGNVATRTCLDEIERHVKPFRLTAVLNWNDFQHQQIMSTRTRGVFLDPMGCYITKDFNVQTASS